MLSDFGQHGVLEEVSYGGEARGDLRVIGGEGGEREEMRIDSAEIGLWGLFRRLKS